MKNSKFIFIISFLILAAMLNVYSSYAYSAVGTSLSTALNIAGINITQNQSNSGHDLEYDIKAAFLYNFIKFIDWPEINDINDTEKLIIGVIGKNNFGDAFKPVQDKKVKGKDTVIKYFKSFSELEKNKEEYAKTSEEILKCHLIFISSSEKDYISKILNIVDKKSILTVGETKNFLKDGGIINFVLEENKVRFEINLIAAKQSDLTIRSQLLRLAKSVIEEKK